MKGYTSDMIGDTQVFHSTRKKKKQLSGLWGIDCTGEEMGAGEARKQELIFTQCGARGKELTLLAKKVL